MDMVSNKGYEYRMSNNEYRRTNVEVRHSTFDILNSNAYYALQMKELENVSY